jgi:hypothetical protein
LRKRFAPAPNPSLDAMSHSLQRADAGSSAGCRTCFDDVCVRSVTIEAAEGAPTITFSRSLGEPRLAGEGLLGRYERPRYRLSTVRVRDGWQLQLSRFVWCFLGALFLLSLAGSPVFGQQFENQLAWVDNSNNEDGFRLERKLGPTGNYAALTTVGPNTVIPMKFARCRALQLPRAHRPRRRAPRAPRPVRARRPARRPQRAAAAAASLLRRRSGHPWRRRSSSFARSATDTSCPIRLGE